MPQIGRVIIQDDVEIGANTTIDRGANRDTVIGEGTKIDNLVQIAHNVVIGRHCVIVSQVGDFRLDRGRRFRCRSAVRRASPAICAIGMGAQIAAQSGVMADVAPGAKMGGSPASDSARLAEALASLDRSIKLAKGRGA